jgi:hypothetical protein
MADVRAMATPIFDELVKELGQETAPPVSDEAGAAHDQDSRKAS